MRRSWLVILATPFLLVAPVSYATVIPLATHLSNANEFPLPTPAPSTGMGDALVTLDTNALTLRVQVSFSGLSAGNTAAHIHCCVDPSAANPTAGVATTVPTFTDFPSGTTSGTYDHTFDLHLASSFNPAFVALHTDVAGAAAFLIGGMLAGDSYLNIHTTVNPGGEIRGFLVVPEPSLISLLVLGLAAGLIATRRKTRLTAGHG